MPGSPRILFLDIETKPLLAWVWSIWQQNVGLNQIKTDWSIMSFAAKWSDSDEVIYKDLSGKRNVDDDRSLLHQMWKLLDAADVVVAHNGVGFDKKKIFARFAMNGMPPPSTFRMIDTLQIARKAFGFTSTKLEYLADKLNTYHKKLKHSGFELWKRCIAGDEEAWAKMREYNIADVYALEELYYKLSPWDGGLTLEPYTDEHTCRCGSTEFQRRGYHYTSVGKYQCYRCKSCGAQTRDRTNLLDKEHRARLRVGVR